MDLPCLWLCCATARARFFSASSPRSSSWHGSCSLGGNCLSQRGSVMAETELRADSHSIEPIPDADRDSTGPQQMWIWAGANIAPVNWALCALGIILKLGLLETIAVIVIGNLFGCAIFGAFTVMGHKTGVSQMVLSRSAFGRRGAYLPSVLMFLMTLCW